MLQSLVLSSITSSSKPTSSARKSSPGLNQGRSRSRELRSASGVCKPSITARSSPRTSAGRWRTAPKVGGLNWFVIKPLIRGCRVKALGSIPAPKGVAVKSIPQKRAPTARGRFGPHVAGGQTGWDPRPISTTRRTDYSRTSVQNWYRSPYPCRLRRRRAGRQATSSHPAFVQVLDQSPLKFLSETGLAKRALSGRTRNFAIVNIRLGPRYDHAPGPAAFLRTTLDCGKRYQLDQHHSCREPATTANQRRESIKLNRVPLKPQGRSA